MLTMRRGDAFFRSILLVVKDGLWFDARGMLSRDSLFLSKDAAFDIVISCWKNTSVKTGSAGRVLYRAQILFGLRRRVGWTV